MAWNDPFETFVGASGQAYTADVGTSFPSGFTTPSSSWTGLGYATEDGVAVSVSRDVEEFRVWQSLHPVRRSVTGETFSVGVALAQWNEETVPLAFGGGTISSVTGGYEYTPPDPEDGIEERAMLVDISDGDRNMRIMIPRGTVAETVEATFTRGALAVLPVTFNALASEDGAGLFSIRFSDETAFAAGS